MVQLFIGAQGVGRAAAVKIMVNNDDDPLTTPNTDYGKFLFNSETQDIGYINKITSITYGGLPSGNGSTSYYPPGTNAVTSEYIGSGPAFSGSSVRSVSYNINNLVGFTYPFFPIVELRLRNTSSGRYSGPSNAYSLRHLGATATDTGVQLSTTGSSVLETYDAGGGRVNATRSTSISSNTHTNVISVIELPVGYQDIASPVATPAAGQENFRFSPALIKVARPGFDINSASGRQLILDSDRIPAKLIRAGEFTIGSGNNVFISSPYFRLGINTYVDYNVGIVGSTFYWPTIMGSSPNKNYNLGLEYVINTSVNNSGVTFYNTGDGSLVVRYMIYGDDDSVPTSGGSAWFRKVGANDEHWQIKRPGSSDTNPSLRDIMLDTRLAYVPILANGYFAVGDMPTTSQSPYPGRERTVTFDPKGFRPFLKYYARRRYRTGTGSEDEPRWYAPQCAILTGYGFSNLFFGQMARDGCTAVIADNRVTFRCSPDNPSYVDADTRQPIFNLNQTMMGFRYYIFGVPTSL